MTPKPAGLRRHRVTIARRTTTTNQMESEPHYTPVMKRWASIEPLSVREQLVAADSEVYADTSHKITMLYTQAIGKGDQIWFKGRKFEVVGQPIDPEEAHREITIMAVERVG